MKLILRNSQAPSDLVMLTAAMRDLHRHHSGLFQADVRTSCPAWVDGGTPCFFLHVNYND